MESFGAASSGDDWNAEFSGNFVPEVEQLKFSTTCSFSSNSMAQISRSVATLRIAGDDLDPQEITALLGRAPTRAYRKGDPVAAGSGTRIAPFGHRQLCAKDAEPENLERQVAELLSGLNQDVHVWRLIARRYSVDLFCGLFMQESNEGVGISPGTLHSLAQLGIKLDLDIYAADADR